MRHKWSAVWWMAATLGLVAILTRPGLSEETAKLVDVGGYKLYTVQAGSAGPTVVFESGLGEDVSTWQSVQPDIAKFARTFAYDRAGLGKSEASPQPKTIEQMVSELHAVLSAAKVAPPYILVGHSLGGAVVELYAHEYPTEIAGLVLVDPEDGRLLDQLHAKLPSQEWEARQAMLEKMMSAASPAQKAELDASKASGKELETASLPDVPTLLLTGTLKDPGFPGNPAEQDLKLALHKELLSTLKHGRQVLVPESRHYIQEDAPKVVIEAVHEVAGKSGAAGEPAQAVLAM